MIKRSTIFNPSAPTSVMVTKRTKKMIFLRAITTGRLLLPRNNLGPRKNIRVMSKGHSPKEITGNTVLEIL